MGKEINSHIIFPEDCNDFLLAAYTPILYYFRKHMARDPRQIIHE